MNNIEDIDFYCGAFYGKSDTCENMRRASNYENPIKSSVQVIEESMNMHIIDVENDFKNWLFNPFSINSSNSLKQSPSNFKGQTQSY